MVEPSLANAKKVFSKYSSHESIWDAGIRYLDAFQCKCAIAELYGIELKKKELTELLSSINCSYWESCGVIIEDAFLKLFSHFQAQQPVNTPEQTVFGYLDQNHKGYVTEADFVAAMASIAPTLAAEIGHEVFAANDTYEIGKVTFPQFREIISGNCD